ncbi:Lysophosphatidic acid:oleoyl-CoA acyltransferase 1 [Coemansia sp. RSA 1199]|nr:Lysophosphatidic acid:oleoyl-CoA acyltransferase 1 [Coemansia sp. RSA 1199]
MEKFSKWRDSGTGIQPFLQPVPARTQQSAVASVFGIIKSYAVGPVASVVRLAALAAIAALDVVTAALGTLLVVPQVRRGYSRLTRSALARLALFIMGFHTIDAKTVSLRKGRRSTTNRQSAESGDVIVANHVSYIDILWLVARYNPVFVELDNASTRVRPVSMWTALRAPARATPALLPASEAQSLGSVVRDARVKRMGPVVVFPENATTNGRALLQLLPVFEDAANLDEKAKVYVMALKYPAQAFSPVYSLGNQFVHLFGVCAQIYNSLVVRMLDPEDCPRMKDAPALCDEGAEPVDIDDVVADRLMQLSRLRMTKLTAMDKRDFLAFYHKRAKGYRPTI